MILILKLFIKEAKLLFFITNLRAFCIHFLQILPSEFAGNTLRFRRKFQYIFQTKFFALEFEGISYNSAYYTSSLQIFKRWRRPIPIVRISICFFGQSLFFLFKICKIFIGDLERKKGLRIIRKKIKTFP